MSLGSAGEIEIPFGEDAVWTMPVKRHACCEVDVGATFKQLLLSDGAFYDPALTDGENSAVMAATFALYANTDVRGLSPEFSQVFAGWTVDGDGNVIPAPTISYGNDQSASQGGEASGEYPMAEGDIPGGADPGAVYVGRFLKEAYQLSVSLTPAWRAIDSGPILVRYRIDTQKWTKEDGIWIPDGDPEEGTERQASIPVPAVGESEAFGEWQRLDGSTGVQKFLVVISARIGSKCLGDLGDFELECDSAPVEVASAVNPVDAVAPVDAGLAGFSGSGGTFDEGVGGGGAGFFGGGGISGGGGAGGGW